MDAKWIEFFKQLGFITASQVLLLIVIGFFGKKIVEFFFSQTIEVKKAELNQNLEAFKQTLTAQTQAQKLELDKNLETYKNTLQQISQENQIKFSKLHQERAAIIKEFYSKLAITEKSMNSYMAPFQPAGDPPMKEKSEVAAKDANDFLEYYRQNEIVFNNDTCAIIEKLNASFVKAWNEFNKYQRKMNSGGFVSEEEINKSLAPYYNVLKKEIPELKGKLKEDFRKTLGVR